MKPKTQPKISRHAACVLVTRPEGVDVIDQITETLNTHETN